MSELLEAFRTGEGVDLIRESVRMVMLELIEAQERSVGPPKVLPGHGRPGYRFPRIVG